MSSAIISIRNVLGRHEIVPASWEDEDTTVRKIDNDLRAIIDSCKLKPRKTNPTMPAVVEVEIDLDDAFSKTFAED